MGLLVSDFRGFLSFKYPILLPHQLLVWETWSASAREPVLYAEEGEEAGRRARPLMAELWGAAVASEHFLCPASVHMAAREAEADRLFTGWGWGMPNDTEPRAGTPFSSAHAPLGRLPSRPSLPP